MKKKPIDINKLIEENKSEIDRIMKDHIDGNAMPKSFYEDNKAISRVINILEKDNLIFPDPVIDDVVIPKLVELCIVTS